MTHNAAEHIMANLGLELFPGLTSGYDWERMSQMCQAFEVLTGRAARPVLNRGGYYLPELED